jgi:hypothetical protein
MEKSVVAILNNLGEHNKQPLRTFWQHEENYRETHWEHQKLGPLEGMLSLLIGCMEFVVFLKLFVTIFDLG